MRFKPGQKVVCVKSNPWVGDAGTIPTWPMPKYNEVVTVKDYTVGVRLEEYPLMAFQSFHEKWFEPLIEDSVLEAELQTIQQTTSV